MVRYRRIEGAQETTSTEDSTTTKPYACTPSIQPTLPPEREQEQQNADLDNAENIEDGLVPDGDEDHLDEPPDLVDHLNEDSDDKDEIDYN